MKSTQLFLILVFSIFMVSCEKTDSDRKVKFDLEEFNSNLDKWEALNLQDFTYEYSNSGYSYSGIASHISVEIQNGEVANITALVENGIQDADRYLIDDLFEQIYSRFPADGLADVSSSAYLKEIKVEYDENFHFPSEVHYIYHIPEGYDGLWNMHQYIKNFKLVK